jgi:MFS family permease
MTTQVNKHYHNGLVILLLLFTLFVAIYNMGDTRLMEDEVTTLNIIKDRTPFEVMTYYHTNNQLLYSVLLTIVHPFTNQLYLFRWISVSFGALAVAMSYRWGKSLVGSTLALVASLLMTITPIFDRYLREIRGYSATVFFGLVIFFSLWRGVATNKKRYWVSFVIASILGIYTHFSVALALITATFIIAGEWLFARRHRKLQYEILMSYAFSLLAIGMILTILFIPIVHQLLAVPSTEGSYRTDFKPFTPTWGFFQRFLNAFSFFNPVASNEEIPDFFLVLVLLGCLSGWRDRSRRRVTVWLTVWWLLPFLTVPFTLALIPWSIACVRFYMFTMPAYLLLGSYGLVALVEYLIAFIKALIPTSRAAVDFRRRWLVGLGVSLLLLAMAVPRIARLIGDLEYLKTDQAWTSVVAYLRTEVRYGDIILCEQFGLPGGDLDECRWHLNDVEKLTNASFSVQRLGSISDFRRAENLLDTLQGRGRVWFVLYFRGPVYQIDIIENVPGLTLKRFGNTWVIGIDSRDHLLGNLIDCGHWLIEHLPDLRYQFHHNLSLSQLYALSGDMDAVNLHLEKAIHAQKMSNDPNWMKELRTVAAIVRFYAPAKPFPQHSTHVNFDNRIELYGYSLEPTTVSGPSEVRMSFYWQVLAPLEKDYSVFVHLEDAEGNIVSQFDFRPFDAVFPISQWPAGTQVREARQFPIPAELPAGEYTFVIGLYLPDNMSRLGLVADTSGESAVRLCTLVVDRP